MIQYINNSSSGINATLHVACPVVVGWLPKFPKDKVVNR